MGWSERSTKGVLRFVETPRWSFFTENPGRSSVSVEREGKDVEVVKVEVGNGTGSRSPERGLSVTGGQLCLIHTRSSLGSP